MAWLQVLMTAEHETFTEFKESFFYGSRADLVFKFIRNMDDDEAKALIARLFDKVGDLLDDPDSTELIDFLYSEQVAAYRPAEGAERRYVYDDRPFTEIPGPLSDLTVGLVTSSGHFPADDPPQGIRHGMSQEETYGMVDVFMKSDAEWAEVPTDSGRDALDVVHPGYDVRSASLDHEVALPIEALGRAASAGRIKTLASPAYSFVGLTSQLKLKKRASEHVEEWQAAGIEALFLVPV